MQYSRYFNENEQIATKNGTRNIVTADEVLAFSGGTNDDLAELLLDILNGIYTVEDCIKDVKEYESDYAHCRSCDKVINLDKETFIVYGDSTYCNYCMDMELVQ